MRSIKSVVLCSIAAAVLVACGGGGNGDQSPRVAYSSVVNFGDSLSDAGTYKAGITVAIGGGAAGLFTVNGIAGAVGANPVPTYTFAQLIGAAAVGTPTCAARSGGFTGVATLTVAGCTNYAQGGSRVTDPKGVGNTVGAGNFTGPLTEPVVTQVANYLVDANNGGKFKGTELVTVLAGANDIFGQTDILTTAVGTTAATALITSLVTQLTTGAGANFATAQPAITTAVQTAVGTSIATAAAGSSLTDIITAATTAGTTAGVTAALTDSAMHGNYGNAVANATAGGDRTVPNTAGAAAGTAATTYLAGTGATNAVAGMVTAANDLVASINGMIANGAKRIVVSNLPDVSQTPNAMKTIVKDVNGVVTDNSQQQLVLAMTTGFNNALAAGLAGKPEVLFVDAFSENKRQFLNPAQYGLTNIKDTACNLAYGANPLATVGKSDGSSLACNTTNLIAGDTSHFLFADNVHPTPYGHKLLSQYITNALLTAGWL